MRIFHLRDEEVVLINHLRHLPLQQQGMVAVLVADLERQTTTEPAPATSKIVLIRPIQAD